MNYITPFFKINGTLILKKDVTSKNVNAIPNNVTHLTFDWRFNQPLMVGIISNSIKHLEFGYHFNRQNTSI